jgi:hypothetical protein
VNLTFYNLASRSVREASFFSFNYQYNIGSGLEIFLLIKVYITGIKEKP